MQAKIGLLFFALVLILNVSAQYLEKRGLNSLEGIHSFAQLASFSTLRQLASNPYIVSGVALSVLGLALWLGALSVFKLSYLAPMAGFSYVLVALVGWLFLAEPISLTHWIGIGVIVLGVALVNA